MKKNVEDIAKMSDFELESQSWDLLTNRGRVSKKGRILAQRRVRAMGVRFYVAMCNTIQEDGEDYRWNHWGIKYPGENIQIPPEDLDFLSVGVTLSHAMHKLGGGCAKEGAKMYFS